MIIAKEILTEAGQISAKTFYGEYYIKRLMRGIKCQAKSMGKKAFTFGNYNSDRKVFMINYIGVFYQSM
jgi:hypothetical protein